MHRLAIAIAILTLSPTDVLAQGEPGGAHPRIWLDADTLETLRSQASSDPESGAAKAVARCARVRANPDRYKDGVYQGFQFAAQTSTCALAWQLTGDPDDAATALLYFNALLDDYQEVGDGLGGDDVIRHDSGYAMRVFAPWSAIAYDWLHDAPGMSEALRARARGRFRAWVAWYRTDGYLRDQPGANYHAGYVFGTTLIAIAQGNEAGADGAELWTSVTEDLWGAEMVAAVQPGGVLEGGDWAEGWNYGPYSVLEYALAVRALNEQGILLEDFDRWAGSLILRQLIARAPSGGHWPGGDSEGTNDEPLQVSSRTVLATLAGTAPERMREHARALREELDLQTDPTFHVVAALGDARLGESTPLPAEAPTWYFTPGNKTLYARSDWSAGATWTVQQCAPHVIPDHQHVNAGNLVLTRGQDNLIVDPTPYDSLSTLAGNAPTVPSENLPDSYQPSQGFWGGDPVGFAWAHQTASGAVVSRCDYRDQYRFRDEAEPDLDYAVRDTVLVPHAGGFTAVVIDRISTGDAGRPLMLRFRVPGSLTLDQEVATAVVGGSRLHIRRLHSNAGDPLVRTPTVGDCYDGVDRGKCEAPRFAVDEYKLDVPHAAPLAIHVFDGVASGVAAPPADFTSAGDHMVAELDRDGVAFAVIATSAPESAPDSASSTLSYQASAGTGRLHIVLDAPRTDGRANVTASKQGEACEVTVTAAADGSLAAEPLMIRLAADCTLSEDPATEPLRPDNSDGTVGEAKPGRPSDATGGCGCHHGGPEDLAGLLLAGLVVVLLKRRRARVR